jgi:para-aminobenzoate synthetase component 1
MSQCRFEDRLTLRARVLTQPCGRILASSPEELPAAFAQIEGARRGGYWVALLLDYELGEWLEPTLAKPAPPHPRLTALVFEKMHEERPWSLGAECKSDKQASIISVTPGIPKERYLARIAQIRDWIAQGEVYQVNATFPLLVNTDGDPAQLYRQIATHHPAAHAAYIEDVGRTILSFSPELFLQRSGNTLMTRPMKGTAPRSADPETDRKLGEALHASEKNRAENLMIVDLLRNDLGRLARPGTVRADPLFSLEKYPSVWTMTSTVQAEVTPETSLAEILKALFPCGSVTGAPKIAAMKRIQETESEPRGLYCGSLGWLAPNGDFSLNVAIRTLVLDEAGQGRYHVGGGIVYDSNPEQEWDECNWKARILNTDR